MNIKPLSDHILIKPIKEEEKTKAGIFLPDTASKEKSEEEIDEIETKKDEMTKQKYWVT